MALPTEQESCEAVTLEQTVDYVDLILGSAWREIRVENGGTGNA